MHLNFTKRKIRHIMHKWKICAAGALILMAVSCDTLKQPKVVILDQTEYRIGSEGGTIDVSFIPLVGWEASWSEDFVSISPASGEASEQSITMTITVEKNTTPLERRAKIFVKFENNDQTLTITQEAYFPDPDPDPDPDPNPDPDPDPNPDPDPDPDPDDGSSTEDVIPGNDVELK